MKKKLLLIATIVSFSLNAQNLVDTTQVENKNVLLEEYTGRLCPYCPDGHKIANDIKVANPNDIVLIRVHTGGYAPTSYPNLNTDFGSALAGQSGISGYPTGTINRHVFSGSAMSMGRNAWASVSSDVLLEQAVLNIGMNAVVDTATRKLYVEVEVFYNEDQDVDFNRLNVAVLQDDIIGSQSGASSFNPADGSDAEYKHKHILRHLPTGQWGEKIDSISAGTLVYKQVFYNLPENIQGVDLKLEDLDIAVFVTEDRQEVLNTTHMKPKMGSATSITEATNSIESIDIYPNPAIDKVNVEFEIRKVSNISFKLYNLLGQNVMSQQKTFSAGHSKLQVDISDFVGGIYFLELQNGNQSSTHKIIVR
ncbi:MAG: Omp28-related outer membrane protein [Flavobacteriales bacterium]|nr:Omp28-related outer membrane protein [Flavobacteriales bacterium]